ncbi:DNA primase [Myxococcota bacterium]|nr:DNA primase [Myxococcota bacterium]
MGPFPIPNTTARLSRDQIRDVAQRVSIVEVVGGYVRLRRSGVNWTGLCPFHDERTPSFNVNEPRQIFHCFGCGEGGDVFKFLMRMEGLTFMEALKAVADRAGVVLPTVEVSPEDRRRAEERERLLAVNEEAAAFYQRQLADASAGARARAYIHSRGLPEGIVAEYRLGYAPEGWDGLSRRLEAAGFPPAAGEHAGLLIPRDRGGRYDRFRDRLMIPILNLSGRVVAFGGRALGDDPAKYLNSAESPVYAKSEVLYGLHQARHHVQKADLAIVVEGYFDLLSLVAVGVGHVVATCGTALTSRHVDALKRYTRNVVLLFDADAAGQRAACRALEVFLDGGLWPSYLSVPDGKDPDEFVRAHGGPAFAELLPTARPLLERYLELIVEKHRGHPLHAERVLDEAAPIVNRLKPVVAQPHWSWLADRLRVDERLVMEHLRQAVPRGSPAPRSSPVEISAPLRKPRVSAQDTLLTELLVHHTEPFLALVEEHMLDAHVRSDGMWELLKVALEERRLGHPPDVATWIARTADDDLRRLLAETSVREDRFRDEAEVARALQQAVLRVRIARLEAERLEAAEDLRKADSDPTVDRAARAEIAMRRFAIEKQIKEMQQQVRQPQT